MSYTIRPRGRGFLATVHSDNKRHRRTFSDRASAEKWAKTLDLSLDGDLPWWDGTWECLIDYAWQTHYQRMRHKDKHRQTLNQLLRIIGKRTPVDTVNHSKFLEGFKVKCLNEGRKPTTVNRLMSFIRTCLRLAHRHGLIPHVCDFHWAKADRSERRSLTNEEVRAIASYTESKWRKKDDAMSYLYEVFMFLLGTGLRYNEAVAVTWDDIDLDAETLTITSGKHPNSPSAVIPIPAATMRMLRIIDRLDPHGPYDLVFRYWKGYDAIRKAWGLMLNRLPSPIRGITLHSLRHTFCTRLVAAGIPLARVRELARHTSITTTMMYTHAAPKGDDNKVREALNL